MDLFTATIDRETHTLHNIYRRDRFFDRLLVPITLGHRRQR